MYRIDNAYYATGWLSELLNLFFASLGIYQKDKFEIHKKDKFEIHQDFYYAK